MPGCVHSVAILLAICCCTSNAASWGHRQIVTSAYIKENKPLSIIRTSEIQQNNCLQNKDECSAILNIRGGAGSSYGDGYNDGYGNNRDDGVGDDYNGRGSSNNRNDGYDDRDQGYSTSYGSSSGRDRYADNDYGRGSGGDGGNGYYDDEGRYREDDRGRGSSSSSRTKTKTKLPTALTSSNRKLGIIFLSSGAAFTALGITLFFNKTLMRLGNLLFVIGIPLMIGPGRTVGYFLQPKKARATGCLGCGILLVLVGHPVIGILLEVFGLLNLFGNMFPLVMMMAKNMPVVGGLFGGNNGGSGGGGGGKRRDDRYYEDDGRESYRQDDGYERESYRQEERY